MFGGLRNVGGDVKDKSDIYGKDIRISDIDVKIFDEGCDEEVKLGYGNDFDEVCDKGEVLELLIEDDIDVNEYLLKLC